jgi:DNA-binding cell septation regulator SpoVG
VEITEVRVSLSTNRESRVLGYATVVIENSLLIRDIKIIDHEPEPFLAMPSRQHVAHCSRCRNRNWVANAFCGACGTRLALPIPIGMDGRKRKNEDVCHPITIELRRQLTDAVMDEYDRLVDLEEQQVKEQAS